MVLNCSVGWALFLLGKKIDIPAQFDDRNGYMIIYRKELLFAKRAYYRKRIHALRTSKSWYKNLMPRLALIPRLRLRRSRRSD